MANHAHTTTRISDLFRDPALRRIFRDAERDSGAAFAMLPPKRPTLSGGEAVNPDRALVLA